MTAAARIVQISVSNGGVPKKAVPSARVTMSGVEGDAHRDREHHGGPDRAVCLYAMEAISGLRAEGHAAMPGALGENITIEGLDWRAITPGSHILLGERVLLQVTTYTTPCRTIMRTFSNLEYSRVSQKRHPGWSRVYTRVLLDGTIAAGDPVRLLDEMEAAEVVAAASR